MSIALTLMPARPIVVMSQFIVDIVPKEPGATDLSGSVSASALSALIENSWQTKILPPNPDGSSG
ncbi:hypothetical protein [Micromonospora sp. WMMD736]|uniref:hypothetical protein n=1 Tax=Micromonospora sp. WMMD736 TaxID=3404112 RepID=UPI003B92903B